MKLNIDGETYYLNVAAAKDSGALILATVTKFEDGDVFSNATGGFGPIIVTQPIWTSPRRRPDGKVYGLVGLQGGLRAWGDSGSLYTFDEVLAYLNEQGLRRIGNLNETIRTAVRAMLPA